ncbi:MAG: ribbon-helix-helix protein, CopG family [Nitrospirota bacterium]|jgi:Arc/MetJ-type ribon-helix-helix transcriptional regulator
MRSVVSVSLPEKMASQLERFASETGRNKSDVMKEALGLFLWEARFNATRRSLTRKAKAQGIITDEDVFKTVS